MKFYYDNLGKVAMYCENGELDAKNFNVFEYTPTPEEIAMIKENYIVEIHEGKLRLLEHEHIKNKKMQEDFEKRKNDLLEKARKKKATMDDIVDFISKLTV